MNKKICFIAANNLYLYPYLQKYISVIGDKREYDIIFWNRRLIDETCGEKERFSYDFDMDMSENVPRLKKLRGYSGFCRFTKKIIKQKKYSLVILLNTTVGVMLKSTLLKHYKNKYIFDVRDYTYENNKIFYKAEKSLIENSKINIISSDGYKKFLPQGEYTVSHNETDISDDIIKKFRSRGKNNKNNKIVLTFIGFIRFYEQNIKIINTFGNDKRFELRFIGAGALSLSEYCENNNINNVVIHDRFPFEKTLDFLYETDCILNLYGNHTPHLDYALSNKLYYAAKLGMPILVCPDTYMEEISTEYGFGFCFDLNDENAKEKFYEYYNSINREDFYKNCDRFLDKINAEQKLFSGNILKILGEKF